MTEKEPNLECQDMILFAFISPVFSDKWQKGKSFNSEDVLVFLCIKKKQTHKNPNISQTKK